MKTIFIALIALLCVTCTNSKKAKIQSSNNIQLILDASHLIQEGKAECVLIKDSTVFAQERGHGVSPLLTVYENHKSDMENATIVDKVIGRAAAAIAICGKVKHVHGEIMSEDAVEFLHNNGITTSYTTLVHRILNRNKDGLCPLEKSVENIEDPELALSALKKRIEEMQNANKK